MSSLQPPELTIYVGQVDEFNNLIHFVIFLYIKWVDLTNSTHITTLIPLEKRFTFSIILCIKVVFGMEKQNNQLHEEVHKNKEEGNSKDSQSK